MKTRTQKLWIGLAMLSLGLWGCDETDLPLENQCIEARVITHICGNAVIQILSPQHAFLGEDNFEASDGQVYDNVFSTLLDCEDIEKVPDDGSTFLLRFVEGEEPQNCVMCLALPSRMPDEWLTIDIIEDCSQTNALSN